MKTIIVIGNGMVGYKFCEKFVAHSTSREYRLIVFGEERHPAYDRVNLSNYFEHEDASKLQLASAKWYKEQGIELMTDSRIKEIDRSQKTVSTCNDRRFTYDNLVLAMGSTPFVPPIQGVEKEGVFVYRTINDLKAIKAYASLLKRNKKSPHVAILGGGLLGLEAAKATLDMEMNTHVVECASQLMPQQLDSRSGEILRNKLESLGIRIWPNRKTTQILGNTHITSLSFDGQPALEVAMLIISAGIRPRDELGKNCGLHIDQGGGIAVDKHLRTSDPHIFAIGEVASYMQRTYGLVAPGYAMAEVAVRQILGHGEAAMMHEVDMSTKLKLVGVDVASFGQTHPPKCKAIPLIYENPSKHIYKRINLSPDGQKLLGGMLVGDTTAYNSLYQIYINKLPLPGNPETLIVGPNERQNDQSSAVDLPDTAQICSCEDVSKAAICKSIKTDKCDNLQDVIHQTKASTGCGGCKPLVKDLVLKTLESLGRQVKDHICAHFDYTRQELYGILRVKGISSYDEALDQIGHGHGCEICKPVLASLLASIYNDTPNTEAVIQDTNDRFLANIQRNGSYSVVPRVPAGEITPEKLIVLGHVAKKYDLYTKITGGQRIDLFGAKLNDLPSIWKELIDAGFESGHAYGKALRTVKSCVGSTWCRYGMDESVSFAIALEERYKGLRAPHKIKGGVSGCIRECAEARGKDFGIIAVEKGWNLYVCGNGGANPKHGQLLAQQIDNTTCIKYLDRFLMYYIQTAAPLMRTAAWLEQLEGGIDHLRHVVVGDTLGIAHELEEQMQQLVDNYQCEWRQVVESKAHAKRFSHYINSEDDDDTLVFVPMRDQKKPKPWKK